MSANVQPKQEEELFYPVAIAMLLWTSWSECGHQSKTKVNGRAFTQWGAGRCCDKDRVPADPCLDH